MKMQRRWSVAVATAAAVLFMLAFAGSASAIECTTINGEGASLQRVAQEAWITVYNEARRCNRAAISYNGSGSLEGLRQWHAENGVGRFTEGNEDEYIASDDAPDTTQIGNMERIADAGGANNILVIPMLQASISVFVNPPTNCTISGRIGNVLLEEIFRHAVTRWEAVESRDADCAGRTITRVVRSDGSGTTYQFKHYLFEIRTGRFRVEGVEQTWESLQATELNTTWPERGTDLRSARGGSRVVSEVRGNAGTIGYATAADAAPSEEASLRLLEVQNDGTGAAESYGNPVEGREANCGSARYGSPTGSDWSRVYGGNPRIGGRAYPICTLTWDIAAEDYSNAGFGAAGKGNTVKEYLTYALETGGLTALGSRYYRALTAGLQTTAQGVVARIRE